MIPFGSLRPTRWTPEAQKAWDEYIDFKMQNNQDRIDSFHRKMGVFVILLLGTMVIFSMLRVGSP